MAVLVRTFLLLLSDPTALSFHPGDLNLWKLRVVRHMTVLRQTHEDSLRGYLRFGLERPDREVLERALASSVSHLVVEEPAYHEDRSHDVALTDTKPSLTLDFTKAFS
jgi:hypothetical protein